MSKTWKNIFASVAALIVVCAIFVQSISVLNRFVSASAEESTTEYDIKEENKTWFDENFDGTVDLAAMFQSTEELSVSDGKLKFEAGTSMFKFAENDKTAVLINYVLTAKVTLNAGYQGVVTHMAEGGKSWQDTKCNWIQYGGGYYKVANRPTGTPYQEPFGEVPSGVFDLTVTVNGTSLKTTLTNGTKTYNTNHVSAYGEGGVGIGILERAGYIDDLKIVSTKHKVKANTENPPVVPEDKPIPETDPMKDVTDGFKLDFQDDSSLSFINEFFSVKGTEGYTMEVVDDPASANPDDAGWYYPQFKGNKMLKIATPESNAKNWDSVTLKFGNDKLPKQYTVTFDVYMETGVVFAAGRLGGGLNNNGITPTTGGIGVQMNADTASGQVSLFKKNAKYETTGFAYDEIGEGGVLGAGVKTWRWRLVFDDGKVNLYIGGRNVPFTNKVDGQVDTTFNNILGSFGITVINTESTVNNSVVYFDNITYTPGLVDENPGAYLSDYVAPDDGGEKEPGSSDKEPGSSDKEPDSSENTSKDDTKKGGCGSNIQSIGFVFPIAIALCAAIAAIKLRRKER